MARKVTAYACDFRCGRRVITSRKAMLEHEQTCWRNPARRACMTCYHEEPPYSGGNSTTIPGYPYADDPPEVRGCNHEDDYLHGPGANRGLGCCWEDPDDTDNRVRWNCPGWRKR